MKLNRRNFLKTAGVGIAGLETPLGLAASQAHKRPNFVIIFLDDSGYGDFRPFGTPEYPTPNVERMAAQGCRFNNFYVPQAVCSASRSALLSGCYPGRTKVFGAHGRARGLEPTFATMGEVLKSAGYTTAVFGKWHIGDQPDTRPPARGFDESCGLMYSNDMWEFHPERPENYSKYPLQYWENGKIKIERVTREHQPMLTTWYHPPQPRESLPALRTPFHAACAAVLQRQVQRKIGHRFIRRRHDGNRLVGRRDHEVIKGLRRGGQHSRRFHFG
jgi:arylsulfatase A-like enzyme